VQHHIGLVIGWRLTVNLRGMTYLRVVKLKVRQQGTPDEVWGTENPTC